MLGAVVGDIMGSIHEGRGTKTNDFRLVAPGCRPTDDSLLTISVAACLLRGLPYVPAFHEMVARFPEAGWGPAFLRWALGRQTGAYGSYGNGAAMRVSPVAFAFDNEATVLAEAERAAAVTHDHPEGVRGARAAAQAVFLARHGADKDEIRRRVSASSGYDLARTVDEIRPAYRFDVTCQGTVPDAIISFLDSTSFEDAIRNAISLGGDADTLAAIAGPIAQAHYGGVPEPLRTLARDRLEADLWTIVEAFENRFGR